MTRRTLLAAAVCFGINRPAVHVGERFVSRVQARSDEQFHRCTFENGITFDGSLGVVIRNCTIYDAAGHCTHEPEASDG